LEPAPISALTHVSAVAAIVSFAAVLGGVVWFFTRRRARYLHAFAALTGVLLAVYWFAVRPEIASTSRAARGTDPVFTSSDEKHKSLDRAGRFSRKPAE
jgi:hypothetical protein